MSPLTAKCCPFGPGERGGGGLGPPNLVAAGRTPRQVMAASGGGGRPPLQLSGALIGFWARHLLPAHSSLPLPWVSGSESPPDREASAQGPAGRVCAGSRRTLHSSLFPSAWHGGKRRQGWWPGPRRPFRVACPPPCRPTGVPREVPDPETGAGDAREGPGSESEQRPGTAGSAGRQGPPGRAPRAPRPRAARS